MRKSTQLPLDFDAPSPSIKKGTLLERPKSTPGRMTPKNGETVPAKIRAVAAEIAVKPPPTPANKAPIKKPTPTPSKSIVKVAATTVVKTGTKKAAPTPLKPAIKAATSAVIKPGVKKPTPTPAKPIVKPVVHTIAKTGVKNPARKPPATGTSSVVKRPAARTSRPAIVAAKAAAKPASSTPVRKKRVIGAKPAAVVADPIMASEGMVWRMSRGHAVVLVWSAALASDLLATDTRRLAQRAMAVYYDKKGKAFAWQLRIDADRWQEVLTRLG